MKNLITTLLSEMNTASDKNNFVVYSILRTTLLALVKELISANYEHTINDDYNIVILGIETPIANREIFDKK